MTDLHLKYGLNRQQGDAVATFPDGQAWLDVLNGRVGYINLLDALARGLSPGSSRRRSRRPAWHDRAPDA